MRPIFLDNDHLARFEWREGAALAFADYRRGPDRLILTHFETDLASRGKGLAGKLMAAIADEARQRRLSIEPICPYAVDWFDKHPEAADLRVAPQVAQEQAAVNEA
jgi:predicted GNAT family acetyltransferase